MTEQNYEDYSPDERLLQQAQPPPQSPQYDKIIQEQKVSNFLSQTSPSGTLIKIDWILKGFVFDEVEKKWVKMTNGIPDGIRMDFLQQLSTQLTEDVRMTRLSEKQINGIMEALIEWGIDYMDITADRPEYKLILTEEQMSKILYMFWSAVFYTLCRAQNGVERDRMYNSLKMGENFGDYAKVEEKKSLLQSILPWK